MRRAVNHRGNIEERLGRFTIKGDGCWQWVGAKYGNGYGYISVGGYNQGAHRVAWESHHKRPIPAGMLVCHRCDNPGCVRPDHLFLGTPLDNTRDSITKGRHDSARPELTRGERNPQAKLTLDRVRHIRDRLAQGHRQKDIAWAFGVTQSNISHIARGITWRTI